MKVIVYSRAEIEKVMADGNFPQNTAVISFYDSAIKRIDEGYTHIQHSQKISHTLDNRFIIELRGDGYVT